MSIKEYIQYALMHISVIDIIKLNVYIQYTTLIIMCCN